MPNEPRSRYATASHNDDRSIPATAKRGKGMDGNAGAAPMMFLRS
jgi:hypothetical protein